jgi:hypothetical protein
MHAEEAVVPTDPMGEKGQYAPLNTVNFETISLAKLEAPAHMVK